MNEASPSTDSEQLDEYSRFAVSQILERFPAWREHMIHRRPGGYERAFADFELPSPSTALERGLWVSTADHEITVGLHTHHSHFADYENPTSPAHVGDALDHIQEFLDERCTIVSWYVGGRFVASTAQAVTAERLISSIIGSVSRSTVRSWRGTHDREAKAGVNSWLKRVFSK